MMIGAITPMNGKTADIWARAAIILSFWLGTDIEICSVITLITTSKRLNYFTRNYTLSIIETRLSTRWVLPTFFSSALNDSFRNVKASARGAGDASLHDEQKLISAARERRS